MHGERQPFNRGEREQKSIMSDDQSASSSGHGGDYHMCEEDNSRVPGAVSHSSIARADDGTDLVYSRHGIPTVSIAPEYHTFDSSTNIHDDKPSCSDRVEDSMELSDTSIVVTGVQGGNVQSSNVAGSVQGHMVNIYSSTNIHDDKPSCSDRVEDSMELSDTSIVVTGVQGGNVQSSNVAGFVQGHMVNIYGSTFETLNLSQFPGQEENKKKEISERTISCFKSWNQHMVKTAAFDKVFDKLKEGQNWVTIKGNPGEGKTTVGLMVLEELHKCERQVFEVRSPDEFKQVISVCRNPVIMLDDVFGNLAFDQVKWSNWECVLSPLLKEREHKSHEQTDKTLKKDVTVILIGRSNVLNSASVDLGRLSDFLISDRYVVCMDHSVERSIEEKRAIWEAISRSSGVELDKKTVKELLAIHVSHGFPHVCHLFTTIFKNNKSVSAVEFFNKPLFFLNKDISYLFKNSNNVRLFKEMLNGEGMVSREKLIKLDETYKIIEAATELVGTYLKDINGHFKFDHQSIYDSVSFHMCSLDPLFVIQQCKLSFIHERIRISTGKTKSTYTSETSLVAYIDRFYEGVLVKRFATEIESGNFVHVLSHESFTDGTFVRKVMSKMKTSLLSLLHMTDQRNSSFLDRNTFLSLVAGNKSPELLKYIDNCQDIELTEDDEIAVLYGTCKYAASDVLSYLVDTRKSLNINIRFGKYSDKTPLMIAAGTRDVQFIHQILSLNPDPNVQERCGLTALHLCSQYGLDSAVTKLLDIGADIDKENIIYETPLSSACESSQAKVVRLLIERGARVDEQSLRNACRGGDLNIVKLLIAKGARIDYKTLVVACIEGNLGIVKLLIESGASVNQQPLEEGLNFLDRFLQESQATFYKQPLEQACRGGNLDIVKLLIERGAIVDDESLREACFRGNCNIVNLLIEKGARVDGKSLEMACVRGNLNIVELLFQKEQNLFKEPILKACLFEAVKGGNTDILSLLVDKGVSLSSLDYFQSLLYGACEHRKPNAVEWLLQKSVNIKGRNSAVDNALLTAAQSGAVECVDLLLKSGASVNVQCIGGNTALHLASEFGPIKSLILLLRENAPVNSKNKQGETPLHIASLSGSRECVQLLLKEGATVNECNNDGDTALHRTAEFGHEGCVYWLLKAGASFDIQNREGDTALHKAAKRGFDEYVDLLIKEGANGNLQNKDGNTALHIAVESGAEGSVYYLLKAGVTVDKQNTKGDTALHRAAGTGFRKSVDLLLKAGSAVNTQNEKGNTALHQAIESGSKKCINSLLKAGATVDEQNIDGNTALHLAAMRGSKVCVDLLLKGGAAVNIQNKFGMTALDITRRIKSKECVDLLLEAIQS